MLRHEERCSRNSAALVGQCAEYRVMAGGEDTADIRYGPGKVVFVKDSDRRVRAELREMFVRGLGR